MQAKYTRRIVNCSALGRIEVNHNSNSNLTKSASSKPFIISAIFLAFAGSLIGAIELMSLFGIQVGAAYRAFPLHKVLQIDGFLTILIMGIGYMIIPRFRNTNLPSTTLAYVSLSAVLLADIFSIITMLSGLNLETFTGITRLIGVTVFTTLVFYMMRVRPKLLALSDYMTGLSVITLFLLAVFALIQPNLEGTLNEIEMLLLFPIMMILGIEYKTMPSFLAFIRPRRRIAITSFVLAAASMLLGAISLIQNLPTLHFVFNMTLLGSTLMFANSLYIFGGFDDKEILQFMSGEKRARYLHIKAYSKISFLFLFGGIIFAATFDIVPASISFLSYDLAIHFTAIGFIGTTITLYLPLMLPPITGRQVQFLKLNHIPLILIIIALVVRSFGDVALSSGVAGVPLSQLLTSSGWLVVAALLIFVITLRRSMIANVGNSNKKNKANEV